MRVRAVHPRATPTIVVLFSADDGVTWVPVGFDPPNGELSLEAARLRGGPRCRFRAIASAELQSATADTEPFEHAGSPRRLHLDLPKEECGLAAGPVALSALIDTRGLGPVARHEIRWHSSLQGELGAGYELIAELGEGEHVITATAPDGAWLARRARDHHRRRPVGETGLITVCRSRNLPTSVGRGLKRNERSLASNLCRISSP